MPGPEAGNASALEWLSFNAISRRPKPSHTDHTPSRQLRPPSFPPPPDPPRGPALPLPGGNPNFVYPNESLVTLSFSRVTNFLRLTIRH
jgi:hypothetical protein